MLPLYLQWPKWTLDKVDWQYGWELFLHRVRHKAAKAARPSACRFPPGDILQTLSGEKKAPLNVGCEFKVIHYSRLKRSRYSQELLERIG